MKVVSTVAAGRGFHGFRRRARAPAIGYWLKQGCRRVLQTLRQWRHRSRSRAELAALDDRMLRDIGVTRAEAWCEAAKPFWRE